jgi:hypothetical protein
MERKQKDEVAAGLAKHVANEEAILGKYKHLGGALRNGPVGLLVRAILHDEEHHHLLLSEMAKELKALSEDTSLPIVDGVSRFELTQIVEELLKHEEETIENCRKLKLRFVAPESEVFAAILEALISDSAKHQMLLMALNRMLRT